MRPSQVLPRYPHSSAGAYGYNLIARILMPVVFSQYIVSFITYRLLVPVEIAESTTENFPTLKLCTLHTLVLRK